MWMWQWCLFRFFLKTIRRKRKVQMSVSRPGDRETMSEHEEEDSDEDDGYEHHAGGGQSAYGGASGGTGTGRRHDRERSSSGRRDHSASRERSVSPRSDRRSQASSAPPRPSKVTLVKSRKNEGKSSLHKTLKDEWNRFLKRCTCILNNHWYL